MSNRLKNILEKTTGYWLHKSKFLPTGVSLKHDIKRFDHPALKIIFDVGANRGQTYFSFRSFFPLAKIHCFEPVNETFEVLKKNLHQEKNVVLENMALGSQPGQKEISLFADWDGGNSLNEFSMCTDENARRQTVYIDTLDQYCKLKGISHVDLLKIDTEGFELQVMKGAETMLKEKKISFIFCEVGYLQKNRRNSYLPELAAFLENYGFYLFSIFNGGTEDWNKGMTYGNALFVNASLKLT